MRIGSIICDVVSYCNPCETYFEKFSFRRLSCNKKIATVCLSAIACPCFFIGSLAAYRRCLKQFSANSNGIPSDTDLHIELELDEPAVNPAEQVAQKVAQNAHHIQASAVSAPQSTTNGQDLVATGEFAMDITEYTSSDWSVEVDGI